MNLECRFITNHAQWVSRKLIEKDILIIRQGDIRYGYFRRLIRMRRMRRKAIIRAASDQEIGLEIPDYKTVSGDTGVLGDRDNTPLSEIITQLSKSRCELSQGISRTIAIISKYDASNYDNIIYISK